ncbi:M-like protein [Deinococcus depolymerans]|uniref:M-like protein n=1 Tax=Deinococcus depolymerans TaxID=392408 RepID=A0ABN1CM58_9DEIO
MTDDKRHDATHTHPDGSEIRNVDLQFMGHADEQKELAAAVDAESKAPGEYVERGMDKQDVASAQSMDASDPPSTNMGEQD